MTLTLTARFHIGLVNQHLYKDALQGTDISNNKFVVIFMNALASKNHILSTQFLRSPNSDANQIGNFELFGLGKKTMVVIIEEDDEDTYHK
ncbi:hypothetical protein RCL_jg17715.t1 [Rhizophagus clarus]|nr:hypothetical protein RCL_jg17715.t1 [Rhizophagus clarus]